MNINTIEDFADDNGYRAIGKRNRNEARKNAGSRRLERAARERPDAGMGEGGSGAMGESGAPAEAILAEGAFSFFMGEGIISGGGVLLKPGKEACVYRCPGAGAMAGKDVAVKVYKEIGTRSFKAMSAYLGGRFADAGINRRDAMHIFSTPGLMQSFWIESEFSALRLLHGAGVPVPQPFAHGASAIAMEFIGEGDACPRLIECRLSASERERMRSLVLDAIARILSHDLVHGDLSPYNILVRDGKPVIIDFPQAVSARFNADARTMLERDVRNVLSFFSRGRDGGGAGRGDEASAVAATLWRDYRRSRG